MALFNQKDKDEEERRALERELATELAALSDNDNESADDEPGDLIDYVRLDLNTVLMQLKEDKVDSHDDSITTHWNLLRQSLERSDCEFFQPCYENLKDIRTLISDDIVPAAQSETQEINLDEELGESKTTVQDEKVNQPSLKDDNVDKNDEVVCSKSILVNEGVEKRTVDGNCATPDCISKTLTLPFGTDLIEYPTLSRTILDPHSQMSLDFPTEFLSPIAQDFIIQDQNQTVASQHEARESRRLKAQAQYDKECTEAATLLLQLEKEYKIQETTAALLRRETQERSFLALEEIRSWHVAIAEREVYECALMSLIDEESKRFELETARLERELDLMDTEDQAEKDRIRAVSQWQESVARQCFHLVLMALIEYHQNRQEWLEQETKRERCECVQMRAEELLVRRVIIDNHVRAENRMQMEEEDFLAKLMETRIQKRKMEEKFRESDNQKRMQIEEVQTHAAWAFLVYLQHETERQACFAMEQEETLSRNAWTFWNQVERAEQERQREAQRLETLCSLQRLGRIIEQHQVIQFYSKWKRWLEQEKDNKRFNAAKRIQSWFRETLQHFEASLLSVNVSDDELGVCIMDEADENGEIQIAMTAKSQDAALRLQSTFRGFHVRRKFANALSLAQEVEATEDEDGMLAVKLDDFIQPPPELVEGWEDPVLPLPSALCQRPALQDQVKVDVETTHETICANEFRRSNVEAPANLAATLWNKMKRVKQRQQHSHQERQRERDPLYRVSKLLNRKKSSTCRIEKKSNQSDCVDTQGQQTTTYVSWSVTTTAKKKPKGKVPSMVERLRRQTMAER